MGPSLRRHKLNIQAVKMAIKQRKAIIFANSIATAVVLILWKPTVLIYGRRRQGSYAAVAIPMGLVLGSCISSTFRMANS